MSHPIFDPPTGPISTVRPAPPPNVAAIVSMSTACFALVFPWLGAFTVLGLVAVISGLVGHRQALKEGRGLAKLALGGFLLGLLVLLAAFGRVLT